MITRPHGYTRYVRDRCRCEVCRRAKADYERNRRRRNAYGRAHLVDADPVRAHLRALQQAGMGYRRAAEAADVDGAYVYRLLYGHRTRPRPHRVRRDIAARLLAVRLDIAECRAIDATGTRRRLQALIACGWTPTALAARLGRDPGQVRKLVHQRHVQARTAEMVRDLYEQIWDVAPPERSRRERAAADRARRRADASGWPRPMEWDDDLIDLPEAEPAPVPDEVVDELVVDQVTTLGRKPGQQLNHAEKLAATRRLRDSGASITQIAQRLRTSHGAAQGLLRELDTDRRRNELELAA